jgi:hypothetical protein
MFLSNYLLDLPDDIQIYIYKYVFNNTLKDIENNNIKSLYDFYDILIKSKLKLNYSIDNRKYYITNDKTLSKIKYIEYSFTHTVSKFEYIKNIIEDFTAIIYNDDNDKRINWRLQKRCSGIYNVKFVNNTFRVYVNKNKLKCKVDLEKAIILGYELLYYSLKLIDRLELNLDDDFDDIMEIYEWLANHRLLECYVITKGVVEVGLGTSII